MTLPTPTTQKCTCPSMARYIQPVSQPPATTMPMPNSTPPRIAFGPIQKIFGLAPARWRRTYRRRPPPCRAECRRQRGFGRWSRGRGGTGETDLRPLDQPAEQQAEQHRHAQHQRGIEAPGGECDGQHRHPGAEARLQRGPPRAFHVTEQRTGRLPTFSGVRSRAAGRSSRQSRRRPRWPA